jgi:uncharacterized protein (TIGR02996 family)
MMTCDEAFLESILEEPDDDAPRLIYADWLDEHGEGERAEFIRVQVELSRLGNRDSRLPALRQREAELLSRQEAWLGPLRRRVDRWRFVRGLAHLSGGAMFFAAREAEGEAEAWRMVAALALEGLATDQLTLLVGYSRRLPLTALSIQGDAMTGVGLLSASPQMAWLSRLRLHAPGLNAESIRLLGTSPHLSRLTCLFLPSNGLGSEEAAALACWSHAGRLRELRLQANHIGPAGVAALAGSPALARLEVLDLDGSPVGDAGAESLASSPHLAGLRELDLRGTGLGRIGAEALASSPHLASLEWLYVYRNPLGKAGQDILRRRFGRAARF